MLLRAILLGKPRSEERYGRLSSSSSGERIFDAILAFYRITLNWVMRHQVLMLIVTLMTIGFTVATACRHGPKGRFFPQQDTGRLTGNIIADQDISSQAMSHLLTQLCTIVSADPGVDNVIAFSGGQGGSAVNQAKMFTGAQPSWPAARRPIQIITARLPRQARSDPGRNARPAVRAGPSYRGSCQRRSIPIHLAGG